ncbi:uncharacterized protein AB675_6140 [Cyphellophora attinorum]|uniref:Uncharacterized protein n=1 Tax=Cyphellophora attinorum TaxID=1664694 RepID=A0A0N0NQE0_9EURO|nr:uncharacterized protein AB675_6140 [Phialophora attinorum]KPI43798.1 hypothetical protein AB675_6140 [Phialophora attinorum]
MAPSRGPHITQSNSSATSSAKSHGDDNLAIEQQSASSLQIARRNFNYLLSPNSSNQPAKPKTRALLRSVRYITQFIIWRLVRWAKYAAIAAVATTAIGSVVSGVAWIAAPTGIGASIAAATVWGVGKFVARRLQRRWETRGGKAGEKEDGLDEDLREEREKEMRRKLDRGGASLKGMPW